MSDEEISKAPAQDITSTDTDTEEGGGDNGGPRVFDITPDLNIAPAKDEIDSTPSIDGTPNTKNTVETTPSINILAEPTSSIIQSNTEAQPQSDTQKPAEVNTNFGPANPPAKTVGMSQITPNQSPEQINSTEPTNLQEAVASIKISTDKPNNKSNVIASTKIPEKPWLPKKDSIIKPLRTYETDFAEALARKRITTTSAIIAEEKRQEEKPIQIERREIVGDIPVAPYKDPFARRPSPILTTARERPLAQTLGSIPIQNPKPVEQEVAPIPVQSAKPMDNPVNPFIRQNVRPIGAIPTPSTLQREDIFKNAQPPVSPKEKKDSHFLKNFLIILISLILIAGGVYAGYYLYKISPLAKMLERTPKNTNTTVPTIMDSGSFFQVDSKVRIAIDGKNENQIASQIRTEIAKDIETNKIKEIVLTKTTENVTKKVTAEELLEIFTIPVPELMIRSISPDWMLGVYSGIGGQKHVFIITTNNFFQNTFAGIIQWEKTMPQDLKLYTINQNDSNFTLKGQYKDKIIKNKDVREYVLENGHINYLYSFVSNDKLVVTNSEEALDEIIIRLEKNAFVR
jgi:hypothetical protein